MEPWNRVIVSSRRSSSGFFKPRLHWATFCGISSLSWFEKQAFHGSYSFYFSTWLRDVRFVYFLFFWGGGREVRWIIVWYLEQNWENDKFYIFLWETKLIINITQQHLKSELRKIWKINQVKLKYFFKYENIILFNI